MRYPVTRSTCALKGGGLKCHLEDRIYDHDFMSMEPTACIAAILRSSYIWFDSLPSTQCNVFFFPIYFNNRPFCAITRIQCHYKLEVQFHPQTDFSLSHF